jgi:hypothetical protein
MSSSRPVPPEVLLEWKQKANPLNPLETQGEGIPIMEVVLLVACFIVVSLRVYIRVFQTKSFGLDDALVIFSMVRYYLLYIKNCADGRKVPLTGLAISLYLGEYWCLNARRICTDYAPALDRYGWNRHVYDLTPEMLQDARKVSPPFN